METDQSGIWFSLMETYLQPYDPDKKKNQNNIGED